MKIRVITAIVMTALILPFFVFSDTVAFPILIAFLSAVGIYEMQSCIGVKKQYFSSVVSVLAGAVLPFLCRYFRSEQLFSYLFALAFCIIVYMLTLSVFSGKDFNVERASLSGITTVYICFGFSSLVLLRDGEFGAYIFILPFIISWITDTFAYFSGYLFGKHKLIPEVSPKKTVEGSVGGTLFAVLFTLLYGYIIGKITGADVQYVSLAVVALAVSLLSQCGDLIMSLIKRKFEIKDYGKLFPGHGGVLDRFDSIIMTAPIIYFLTELVPFLTLFVKG